VLDAVDAGMVDGVAELHLPRWDFDTAVPLMPVLQALGMHAPFDAATADFSGISETPLWIGDAIHRATITVDEWGTEAAAVTGLGRGVGPPPGRDPRGPPFAFLILGRRKVPPFIGRVADPLPEAGSPVPAQSRPRSRG
jgi:serpin B